MSWGGSNSQGVSVKDANGQVLGVLVGYEDTLTDNSDEAVNIYNPSLQRVLSLWYSYQTSTLEYGKVANPYYITENCTGTAYLIDHPAVLAKTSLYQWRSGAERTLAIFSNEPSSVTIIPRSFIGVDGNQGSTCIVLPETEEQAQAFSLTTVSLPFADPITMPLKF